MDIQVHSIHFTADKKLIACEVYLRLDKDVEKENKISELKLLIPGKTLVAKKQCKSFEEATDLATEALRKQVKKHKEKAA